MSKLSVAEIMERHEYYSADQGLKELHAAAENFWHPLFTMAHTPLLPQFFTKGAMMSMNAPDLRTFMQGLLADYDSYQSITNVAARGKDGGDPTQPMKNQADKLERYASVLKSDFSQDGWLQRDRYWSMGIGPYAVNILRCTDDGFQVDSPSPLSCYHPVGNGEVQRPAMMIRDYEMLASKAIELYTDKDDKKKPGKKNGKAWDWVPLSFEAPTQGGKVGSGGKFAEMVRVIWLDDGETIYHVLMNSNSKDATVEGGKIVYETPNLTGGCSAIMIAGEATPLTEILDRIGPTHMPLMQCVLNLDLLTSMEATMMVQARPDLAVEYSPEQITAMANAGILVPTGENAVAQAIEAESTGGQTVLHFGGKPLALAFAPNESRKMLMEQWVNTRDRYFADWREPTEPSTVSQATVNVYLAARDAVRRRQSTQLKLSDKADTMLINMAFHTIVEREESRKKNEPGYEDDPARQKSYSLHAHGGETGGYGELEAGQSVTITAADLVDFDYTLTVSTTGQTESDRRATMANGMQEVAWGLTALSQVIGKAYVDETAQMKTLAKDAGLRLLRPIAMQALYGIFADKMKFKGIILPPLTPPTGAPTGPSIGGAPQQMTSPSGDPASGGGAAA